jgi:hypothetical protein
VITYGVAPSLHIEFKHSHVKQYFKEQRTWAIASARANWRTPNWRIFRQLVRSLP